MNQELITFDYEENDVRTILKNGGEIWMVVKDVCDVLGLSNSRQAIETLDGDEKGVTIIDTPGGPQGMSVINESGLYTLIMRSNKPEAKKFRRWITHEVLPAIRRYGKYEMPQKERRLSVGAYDKRLSRYAGFIGQKLAGNRKKFSYGEVASMFGVSLDEFIAILQNADVLNDSMLPKDLSSKMFDIRIYPGDTTDQRKVKVGIMRNALDELFRIVKNTIEKLEEDDAR